MVCWTPPGPPLQGFWLSVGRANATGHWATNSTERVNARSRPRIRTLPISAPGFRVLVLHSRVFDSIYWLDIFSGYCLDTQMRISISPGPQMCMRVGGACSAVALCARLVMCSWTLPNAGLLRNRNIGACLHHCMRRTLYRSGQFFVTSARSLCKLPKLGKRLADLRLDECLFASILSDA